MSTPASLQSCRALVFDLMGTCVDWHSSLLPLLPESPVRVFEKQTAVGTQLNPLLMKWRMGFFAEIQKRYMEGKPPEDIDVTHQRVLDDILQEHGLNEQIGWTEEKKSELVRGWHTQQGWPDSLPGLSRLRNKFFLVVLANGTTRLQLDIAQSSSLPFHTLFSSQLLGVTKPNPVAYQRVLELLQLEPHECIMVAAHAYDLRAAKEAGMRTIYIQRRTEDPDEDMDSIRAEVDAFVNGIDCSPSHGGLVAMADMLGA